MGAESSWPISRRSRGAGGTPQPSKLAHTPCEISVFGPESFNGAEAEYEAEEQRQIEAAIIASLADAPAAESPPIDHGAKRAECYHTPPSGRSAPVKKSGKKTRGGRLTKPLQTANRG